MAATSSQPLAIPLSQSWFCESCQVIANTGQCPCCASAEHTSRMDHWLNREEPYLTLPRCTMYLSIGPPERGN